MIRREVYLSKIRPFIGNDLIKVLTGIRRSGKSVMLKLIEEELLERGATSEQFISYNFENMSNAHLLNAVSLHSDVSEKIKNTNGKSYLFFDEIQEVKDWEKCVNSLRVEFDCDIYITGSNAKLLSGELATYLSGRYVEFLIYPFSYSEFTELYKTNSPKSSEREIFSKFLTLGGIPYLSNLGFDEEPSRLYLQDLYNSVVLKDVVKRNSIRDIDLLERIISYITANVGTTFSATTISKYFKNEGRTVAPETILNYIKACEDAFLFYRVKREDLQGKKILSVNEKYYIADQGIREAVFGGNMKDINLILENIIYMELLRRGYNVTVGKFGEKEIDFVAVKQNEKIYVQVSYLLASENTVNREFSVYNNIRDNYPKYVLSLDEIDMSQNGIIHKNIKDFLLDL
ncbi:MAG: ATP-binding protein [Clostridia bacterium]